MELLRKLFSLVKNKQYDNEAIKDFMDRNDKLTFGRAFIDFFDFNDLAKAQEGFSVDENGKPLFSHKTGSWDETWLVIGTEGICNDPVFVDTYNEEMPVYTAIKENGNWEPIELAASLANFSRIIHKVRKLNEENQVAEGQSLIEAEKQAYMAVVNKENANLDNWWWESLLL